MTLKTADMPINPKVTREKTYLESSLSSLNNSMSNINSASNNSNSSPERSRFGGGKSYNMFFIRHTAQPRNLRLMTGNNNIQLCTMKENTFSLPDVVKERIKTETLASLNLPIPKKPVETISDPKFKLKLDENLISKYEDRFVAKRRKERILPPIKLHTCTFTLADDTFKWREELNSLGKMIGILTEEEINNVETEHKKPDAEKSKPQEPHEQSLPKPNDNLADKIEQLERYEKELITSNVLMNMYLQNNSTHQQAATAKPETGSRNMKTSQDGDNRSKTGRFNESRSNAAFSRKASRRGTNGNRTAQNKFILCFEDSEREMWLLQILCQILKTESLQEIQSWLCSSNSQEKSAMTELIQKSLEGLRQGERIDKDTNSETKDKVDFDHISSSITTFMDNQRGVQFSVLSQHSLIKTQGDSASNFGDPSISCQESGQSEQPIREKIQKKLNKHSKNKNTTKEKKSQQQPDENTDKFNSVSLCNMGSNYGSGYGTVTSKIKKTKEEKREKKESLDNFESFLSKSTYFQPKCKVINDYLLPYTRPFTTTENSNFTNRKASNEELREQAITLTLRPLDKELLNRYQRVKVVDPMPKLEENPEPSRRYLTLAAMEYENNKLLNNPNQFNTYEK